jgi:hypothetical protein
MKTQDLTWIVNTGTGEVVKRFISPRAARAYLRWLPRAARMRFACVPNLAAYRALGANHADAVADTL